MNNPKTKESTGKAEVNHNSVFFSIQNSLWGVFPLFKKNYTYISAEITIQGDLIAQERVVVDGSMYGNIRAAKHITLGSSAHFEGSIECESAVISGYVKGRVQAKKLLLVKTPATIIGDLLSASVQLESGVIFRGKIISNPAEGLLLGTASDAMDEIPTDPEPETSANSEEDRQH